MKMQVPMKGLSKRQLNRSDVADVVVVVME